MQALTVALERIANHAHCSYHYPGGAHPLVRAPAGGIDSERQYQLGVADGHRCAAEIAREALARAAEEEETDP